MGEKARLVTVEELKADYGHGWEESWVRADPEEGYDEHFELTPCAWCMGTMALPDRCHCEVENIEDIYNRRYGLRVWSALPDEAQREAEKWHED